MKAKNERKVTTPINEKIQFDKMQVISAEGENLGVLSKKDALKRSNESGLDLVLMSEKGGQGFPVVKVMDFGKALYSKKKQLVDAKKHQKTIQIKEVKLRPKIGEHDYQTKVNQAIAFLKTGKHVKVTLMFKGREVATKEERGNELFRRINASFEDAGLTKIFQEKDSKTFQMWSRVYYLKK